MLRRRYRESDRPQNCICGETERLQLHHLTYERVGAERLDDLTPLCANCHAMIHELERRGEIGLDFTGFVDAKRAERNRSTMRDSVAKSEAARQDFLDEIDAWTENLTVAADRAGTELPWALTRELKRLRRRVVAVPFVAGVR